MISFLLAGKIIEIQATDCRNYSIFGSASKSGHRRNTGISHTICSFIWILRYLLSYSSLAPPVAYFICVFSHISVCVVAFLAGANARCSLARGKYQRGRVQFPDSDDSVWCTMPPSGQVIHYNTPDIYTINLLNFLS